MQLHFKIKEVHGFESHLLLSAWVDFCIAGEAGNTNILPDMQEKCPNGLLLGLEAKPGETDTADGSVVLHAAVETLRRAFQDLVGSCHEAGGILHLGRLPSQPLAAIAATDEAGRSLHFSA